MYVKSFKELQVWQRSIELTKEVYRATEQLPQKEMFGLQTQMRRSAVSIASNIAEGHRRSTRKDFINFLRMADGSSAELETQMIICESLSYELEVTHAKELLEEVQKMLSVMIKKLLDANR